MENLKTVSALVKNILEHDHKARNTDNHLYLMVLEHYSGLRGIDIHAMTVPVFLKELETALFHRMNAKRCAVCRALFTPGSNRAKYCPECAARMKRINAAKRKRKQREKCHALGAENPL